MGRKKRNFNIAVIIAFVPLIALAYFLSQGYAIELGFDSQMASDIMGAIPGLFLFIIGMGIIATIEMGNPAIVAGFTTIGIGIAFLLQELYTLGMITEIMLDPATILQVEELVIIGCIMVGAVAWASFRR